MFLKRIVFALFLPALLCAQTADFLVKSQQVKSGITLPYRLFIPKNYDAKKSYPLIMALHGYGERGTDDSIQLTHYQLATLWAVDSNQTKHPSFIYAPQCPADGNDSWVNVNFGAGTYRLDATPISVYLQAALEILDTLCSQYSVDSNRVYVVGLSMGGYATWDVVMRFSNRFAAAVPIAGAGDTTKAPLLIHLPIWDFHGSADSTVPVEGSRQMIAAIKKAGGNPRYTEYPGVGHSSWVPALEEPALPGWLFAQSRPLPSPIRPAPKNKNIVSPTFKGHQIVAPDLNGGMEDGTKGDVDGLGRTVLPFKE